jgi:galactose-1-phosphate uridylyltransferase
MEDARRAAEAARSTLPQREPFTRLAAMNCTDRLANKERVVWEDTVLMALVDFGNRGSKLLIVPKAATNFPTDLRDSDIAYVSRVAAATCDALMAAAGKQASTTAPSCRMYINPPGGLHVRQLHVHVQAQTGVAAPVDDTFLQRAGANLRSLLGGAGCF